MAGLACTCLLCQPHAAMAAPAILDHLRLMHPDAYGDGFVHWLHWPDGVMVVIDETLQPSDFAPPEHGKAAT